MSNVIADREMVDIVKFCIYFYLKHSCCSKSNARCSISLQHEYMSYMDKKETMRKTAIITLSDHYKHEIQDIQDEKSLMELEFNQKKEALQKLLMEKENTLKKTTEELSQLQEYKVLKYKTLVIYKYKTLVI